MRIVFMGTPEFAVASLDALFNSSHEVVGVVTVADKASGRGRKVHSSAVKEYALSKNILTLQPLKLKDSGFLKALEGLRADLFVVVAFRMLPDAVWKMPSKGTINLHGSLLPRYRGAAPINWAVINGDKETGYSSFYINEEIDKGALLFQERMPIHEDEDAGSVHDRMMLLGALLVVKTVNAIEEESANAQPQNDIVASHAPKLNNENRRIDWTKPSTEIKNLIRGLSPYPSAYSILHTNEEELTVKFFKVEKVEGESLSPGIIKSDGKTFLYIGSRGESLSILELQVAGKRRMSIKDLLNGWELDPNWQFH
jgi:methionyl-tRNA formyltransferase